MNAATAMDSRPHFAGTRVTASGMPVSWPKMIWRFQSDAPAGGMPKPVVLIGSGATCDARFKWFQGLKRYLNVPQWTLEIPFPGLMESFLAR